jgi:hypothetical protein
MYREWINSGISMYISLYRIYLISDLFSIDTSAYIVCTQSQQTSTNGSFPASFGCDEDMETFSLTNDGANQSWSLPLDNTYRIDWIFLSIGAGKNFFAQ